MKIITYGFFVFLGVFSAEVLSFNHTTALVEPFGTLAYAFFYIFILERIITKQIDSWKVVYLYGIILGLFVEGYFTKIVFFGGNESAVISAGFAIQDASFLALFFHPIFSLILPIWVLKRYFKYPINLPDLMSNKKWLALIFMHPIIFSSWNFESAGFAMFSLIAILLFVFLLKYFGKTKNFKLNLIERGITLILFLITYGLAFVAFPHPWDESVQLPGIMPLFILTLAILVTILVIRKYEKGRVIKKIAYEADFSLREVLSRMCFFTIIVSLLIISKLSFLASPLVSVLFSLGGIFGVPIFLYLLYGVSKDSKEKHPET